MNMEWVEEAIGDFVADSLFQQKYFGNVVLREDLCHNCAPGKLCFDKVYAGPGRALG
jgi:hypothetical protein